MKFQRVNIGTARITGLNGEPTYFKEKCFYRWSIMFEDASNILIHHLPWIYLGNTKEDAVINCKQLKENFEKARIFEDDMVAIMYENNGDVIAIGNIGQDVWIDVTDKLTKKTFSQMNIVITSLIVH